ncbi:AAA family ATPase [Aurantimonas aggregata]|uniref:Gluconokinase n=1 Tax=Aurantimonas aggregata TaxID=2047720 RepID=A0A6L9MKX7_9HYPH|nr:gluconokinase [Aurantimonas aggregata]NDV88385.1 AAA family ATPase [Aurantimonas aggregata]
MAADRDGPGRQSELTGEIPTALVVMGPSGVGKSTTAEALAAALGWPFAEADRFHPKANIAKMTTGHPLDDADRAPWLAEIRDWITAQAAAGRSTVLTCSALKHRYRDVLRESGARVRFVALTADPALVASRLEHRSGHYMPATLLQSQFDALEPLGPDEDGVTVTVDVPPPAVVARVLERLGLATPG